ncbi:hypothetical protein BH09VER1_BH09VER1_18480 [soil metagenome]
MSGSERGILYVATGDRFVAEARLSALSAKQHMPDLPTLLYTDRPVPAGSPFDEVRRLESPRHFFVDKVAPLAESPFERTLFLDTDTFVCAPVYDLFTLLDRYDLALAHAPLRHDRPFTTPTCFAELNTGVIAYRPNRSVKDLIARWASIYEEEVARSGPVSDQAAFRQAAYESAAKLYILPSEYNLRTVMPAATGRGTVKIIHGRAPDLSRLADRLNRSRAIRVFLPSLRDLDPANFIILTAPGRLLGGIFAIGTRTWRLLETLKRRLFGSR